MHIYIKPQFPFFDHPQQAGQSKYPKPAPGLGSSAQLLVWINRPGSRWAFLKATQKLHVIQNSAVMGTPNYTHIISPPHKLQ